VEEEAEAVVAIVAVTVAEALVVIAVATAEAIAVIAMIAVATAEAIAVTVTAEEVVASVRQLVDPTVRTLLEGAIQVQATLPTPVVRVHSEEVGVRSLQLTRSNDAVVGSRDPKAVTPIPVEAVVALILDPRQHRPILVIPKVKASIQWSRNEKIYWILIKWTRWGEVSIL